MKRTSAFTLLELLVSVAIVAVLAALLFPVASKIHIASQRATALSNIRQIGAAHLLYASEHDGGLPPLSAGMVPGTGQTLGPWCVELILPYLGYPSDYAYKQRGQAILLPKVYYNPLVKIHHPWTDFGVNRFVYYTGGVSFKLVNIANKHTVMLMDSGPDGSAEGGWMLKPAAIAYPSEENVASRKDNKLSLVYFDGSAETITKQYFIENSKELCGPNYGQGR